MKGIAHTKQIGRLAGVASVLAATVLATPATGEAGSSLVLWAEESIKISGNANTFCGWAHSNGSVHFTGQDNAVSGRFEYVDDFRSNNNNDVTPEAAASGSMPRPPHDIDYYRSRAQSGGTYFPGKADIDAGSAGGLVFAEGDIHVSGSDVSFDVTLISAAGEIAISGSRIALRAAVDGLLLLAGSGDAFISGSGNSYNGSIFVPQGDFSRHGADDSVVAGPVIASTISWSGSRGNLGGVCCDEATACDDGNGCTTDWCNAGACDFTTVAGCQACSDAAECADGTVCTDEVCTAAGVCEWVPEPGCIPCDTVADCTDANACSVEACGSDGSCEFTMREGCIPCQTKADCEDGDACTAEACGEGICAFSPSGACPVCVPEVCADGQDNDCDGVEDCADTDCARAAACGTGPEVCGDCVDNDRNGLVDYEDPACCEATVELGLRKLKLRPSGKKRDRIRLQSQYSPVIVPGFDPLTYDTSIQLSDADGVIFCTTITADHWMVRQRRHLAFWDRKGQFSGGLSDGRFTVKRNGKVLFRTHGKKAPLRTMGEGGVRVTVRTGAVCSQAEATLRARKATLIAP